MVKKQEAIGLHGGQSFPSFSTQSDANHLNCAFNAFVVSDTYKPWPCSTLFTGKIKTWHVSPNLAISMLLAVHQ